MSNSNTLVTLHIDDQEVQVPRGTNVIEAALKVQTEIPFYCYHRHLSIAGNCRMCQVELEGAPKLTIACNTLAQEGMKIRTHKTSKKVRDAQRATLEFLLINHPLDCTVCDQAGHCKLQDYYFEYNKRASRFIEEKVNKVKAEDLGPEVKYDGERCIVCTRCVRFCDEFTETSELSVLNRGDRTVIAVNSDQPLDNPFSGSTVDLCPVGALTHKRWRFNSRIWYSGTVDSVCQGCSTGCNVKVAVRDDTVVQVKGRLNSDVNQEWMCDEGRYGFSRFQPEHRLSSSLIREGDYLTEKSTKDTLSFVSSMYKDSRTNDGEAPAILISPFLTMEEQWVAIRFAEKVFGVPSDSPDLAIQYRTREITELEARLVNPDYAPNARAGQLLGYMSFSSDAKDEDWRARYNERYNKVLDKIRSGSVKQLLLIGDQAIADDDLDDTLIRSLLAVPASVALSPRAPVDGESSDVKEPLGAHQLCRAILPTLTVNEKSGVFVNAGLRLQRLMRLLSPPIGVMPEWSLLHALSTEMSEGILPSGVSSDRDVFQAMVADVSLLKDLRLADLGDLGLEASDLPLSVSGKESGVSTNKGEASL